MAVVIADYIIDSSIEHVKELNQANRMKVLMLSRSTLFSSPGGDTIQIEATAKYLRQLGVVVDIKISNDDTINYENYDLLHFFNLIRPNDFLVHARKSKKPFVLSTIYVDYFEYERKSRKGITGFFFKFFGKYHIEYFKTVARAIRNNERIVSKTYLLLGQKRAMQKLIKHAAYLLPNSKSEIARIERDLRVKNNFSVIPNAIDPEKFIPEAANVKREGIICVARIEGLKNQLNLIKAMRDLPFHLTIIGKSSPNHSDYFEECRAIAGKNVSFMNHVTQNELRLIYAKAKVHVLPSWFETTGLSTLEAAYMGCNIVITRKGDTEEYFGDFATYCDPESVESIREALIEAYGRPYPKELKNKICSFYAWEHAASKTLEVYKKVVQ